MVNSISVHSEVFGQRGDTPRYSVNSNNLVPSRVSGLLYCGSPPDIRRLVNTVIVNALNGHSRWALPHVGKEVLKTFPTLTHSNSSLKIILSANRSRRASLFHRLPCQISTGLPACGSLPVGCKPSKSGFTFETTARSGASRFQITASHNNFAPTITETNAATVAINHSAIFNNKKPSKPLANKGNSFRHDINGVVFSGGRSASTGAPHDSAIGLG